MLSLKRRMARVTRKLFSAITSVLMPGKVALRPIPVRSGKSQARLVRKHK